MHGSPLLRAILAFLAILALGFPLWKLTRASEAQAALVKPVETESKAIRLQLAFTQVPTSFQVLALGKAVWTESAPSVEMSRDLKLQYPKEGIDLEIQLDWPGENLSAARLHLTDPDGRELEKTVWGKGKTDEVVTFP